MKMKILIIIVLLLIGTVKNLNAQTFSGGTGSQSTPYLISNIDDILELTDLVNNEQNNENWSKGKFFRLIQDITDTVRTPIGNSFIMAAQRDRRFRGNFDGNGYRIIIGMNIVGNFNFGGLFGVVVDAKISNLRVEGYLTINAEVGGGIVGQMSTTANEKNYIINCVSSVNLTAISGHAGGIVGNANNVIIKNCIYNGTLFVSGNTAYIPIRAGGIAGSIDSPHSDSIINCFNLGNILNGRTATALFVQIGGVVGNAFNLSIINGANYGFVKCNDSGTATNSGVGGITGYAVNTAISNNFNSGVVIGNGNVGCIIGNAGTNTVLENNHYDKQMCGD